ncbi:hypothetical protein DKT75_04545 [Leucothrix arctica]|uniref:Uncharacterized protein n=1 Tax=Leucothrix arctica TaxID=1481894 RepID=A0A317CJQ7_9GAMM|nr:hypothetical protein DKT75_04545 [Leucothrix arctica]
MVTYTLLAHNCAIHCYFA